MSQSSITEVTPGGSIMFSGPDAVAVYRATVIGSALRTYARTGMRMNRAYTPKAMMSVAAEITGMKFKAREYERAGEALKAWATEQAARIAKLNTTAEA